MAHFTLPKGWDETANLFSFCLNALLILLAVLWVLFSALTPLQQLQWAVWLGMVAVAVPLVWVASTQPWKA